jgi:hypothetical protein
MCMHGTRTRRRTPDTRRTMIIVQLGSVRRYLEEVRANQRQPLVHHALRHGLRTLVGMGMVTAVHRWLYAAAPRGHGWHTPAWRKLAR